MGGVEALLGRHGGAGFDEFVGGGKAFGDVVEAGRNADRAFGHAALDPGENLFHLHVVGDAAVPAAGHGPQMGVGEVGDGVLRGAAVE